MNITDYLVIAAILISAVVGSFRGFLREAIALVTWIIALFLGWHFSDLIAPHLGGLLAGSPVATWAARVILVTLVLFWRRDHWAGILFLPYLAWTGFALLLNVAIWRLNG